MQWLSNPSAGHLVQYYKSDNELLKPLTEFIQAGLIKNEACIIIATKEHIEKLNTRLSEKGIDLLDAYTKGNYITLDARETLDSFMASGMPDARLFHENVGSLVADSFAKGLPIRAYGEMVALLWKAGNKEAVIQLEKLWNELAASNTFSLYCAYPDLHFVLDKEVRQEITDCHSILLPSVAFA